MGESFRGWKRKTGLATLMIACILAVGWKSSHSREDAVYMTLRPGIYHTLSSRYNVLLWKVDTWRENLKSDQAADLEELDGYPTFSHSTASIQFPETTRHFLDSGMRAAIWGFQVGTKHGSHIDMFVLQIPYWLLVVPLTLLSTWLLLSKPRELKAHTSLEKTHKQVG